MRQETCPGRGPGAPWLPVLGRLLAAALLIGGVGIGCALERSGLAVEAEFRCDSLVVNSDGHREAVSSLDTEFSGLLIRDFCDDPAGSAITPQEVWRHHLDRVLSAGPFRGHDAGVSGWCVLSTTCTETRDFAETEAPACPDLTGTTALRDDCAAGSACIQITPEPLDFAAVNLSAVSGTLDLGFENSCTESRFLRADESIFDDPRMQFRVVDNGCVAPDPGVGRELTPFGTPADGCIVRFAFEPKDVGPQSGVYLTAVVEDGALLTSNLQGAGVGTMPRTISGESLFCLDPGAVDCGTVSVGVVSDGPAGFRITATDFVAVRGTGFATPTGPGVDEIFAPGVEARYEVEWCRSRATLARERFQLTVTTTTADAGVTRAFRSTIDAPAPCP